MIFQQRPAQGNVRRRPEHLLCRAAGAKQWAFKRDSSYWQEQHEEEICGVIVVINMMNMIVTETKIVVKDLMSRSVFPFRIHL